MADLFATFPFPGASGAGLRVFAKKAQIEIDLTEMKEQADAVGRQLSELLTEIERKVREEQAADEEQEAFSPEISPEPRVSAADERRIDQLFDKARANRSKAYELKADLDRLGVFDLYEDRFLDLFKKPG